MKKHVFSFALLAVSSAVLVACGGGGTPTTNDVKTPSNTASFSPNGKVIEGYLQNATVCLDLNANGQCDKDEPTDTSKADGSYKLPGTTDARARSAMVLVQTTADTKDADDKGKTLGEAGRKPFTLQAPAALATQEGLLNVTAFTTLLSGEVLGVYINPTKASADDIRKVADNAANTLAGQSAANADLFKGSDYVAAKNTAAQTAATTLSNNLGVAAAAVAADPTGKTLSAAQQQQAVIAIVKESGTSPLTASNAQVAAVKAMTQASATVLGDPLALLQQGGLYDPELCYDSTCGQSYAQGSTQALRGYSVMAPVSGQANTYKEQKFARSGAGYVPFPGRPALYYLNGAWQQSDEEYAFTVAGKVDAAGFLSVTEQGTGRTMKVGIQTVDLSGKPILGAVRMDGGWPAPAAAQNATFPQGSVGYYAVLQRGAQPEYRIHWNHHTESYSASYPEQNTSTTPPTITWKTKQFTQALDAPDYLRDWNKCWAVTNANTANVQATYSLDNPGCTYSSLDAALQSGGWYVSSGITVRPAASGGNAVEIGTMQWVPSTDPQKPGSMQMTVLGTATYADVTQGALQMRYLTGISNELRLRMNADSQYEMPALFVYNGKVASGYYYAPPAGTVQAERDNWPNLNKTGLNAVLKAWGMPELP